MIGEAENGQAVLQLVRQLKPDVIIMDIAMPGLNGIEATRQLTTELPHVKVIGLSMHFDKRFIVKMLHAGAVAYLQKACAFEEVIRAIHTVVQGKYYISDGVSHMTIKDKDQYLETTQLPDVSVLTPRERHILQLIAEGKLTKEIAVQIHLSVKTVEKHRQHIMGKFHVRGVADLTRIAMREGLISPE